MAITEIDINCHNSCAFFAALPPEQKGLNGKAAQASKKGEEFPGSLNTLCGGCVKGKVVEKALEEKIQELLNPSK